MAQGLGFDAQDSVFRAGWVLSHLCRIRLHICEFAKIPTFSGSDVHFLSLFLVVFTRIFLKLHRRVWPGEVNSSNTTLLGGC